MYINLHIKHEFCVLFSIENAEYATKSIPTVSLCIYKLFEYLMKNINVSGNY